MSREYYNKPYFVLVFQLLDVIESTFKIGKVACSNKFSDSQVSFDFVICPGKSMFYLRDISKCEHNTEIVLHLYFPHAVSIVWITSRVEGTLQHPRGIWEWATTKIRCCWKKWKRIFLQWPLQNCTWPVWVSSAAAEKQISHWLLVIFCITQIKTNIWFCFRFTVRFWVLCHIHGIRPPSSGWAGNTLMLSALVSPFRSGDLILGGVMTVKMEVPSWADSIPLVTLLLLFIPLRTLEDK